MNSIDTNIDNYNINDLLQLLDLEDDISQFSIENNSNKLIQNLYNANKIELAEFVKKVKEKLINIFNQNNETEQEETDQEETDQEETDQEETDQETDEETEQEEDEETDEEIENQIQDEKYYDIGLDNKVDGWYENEYLKQDDKNQNNKITERKNKVSIFDNSHLQMKREKLGINETYDVPVNQGTINPNLRNITTRLVCIDSQFRQNILPYKEYDPNYLSSSTNYTLDLTETLYNVLSIKIFSIQIPKTWYVFDENLANTSFYINNTKIDISSGNYSQQELANTLDTKLTAYFTSVTYNQINGKLQFNGALSDLSMIFYDEGLFDDTSQELCYTKTNMKINQNLGWYMGFRIEQDASGVVYKNVSSGASFEANAPLDIYGPKYFTLVVDDFNKNRLNKGLININQTETKLSIPSYYNRDVTTIDVSCNTTTKTRNTTGKPGLTQAQIYSVNQILQNRQKTLNRTEGTTTSDVLSLIPLNLDLLNDNKPYVEFGTSIAMNERKYFGPVDIERLKIRLLDDKGNTVNLHGNDWSFSLTVEQLYQY